MRRELILYATPEGELGDQCQQFFDMLRASGTATTAQAYPPHVTLTGFFRRNPDELERTVSDVGAALQALPSGPVRVDSLLEHNDWVGLDVSSDWLTDVAAEFANLHRLESGDDPIRLKDWLHLSLAYGEVPALTTLVELAASARSIVSINASVSWKVAIWERQGSNWIRHG